MPCDGWYLHLPLRIEVAAFVKRVIYTMTGQLAKTRCLQNTSQVVNEARSNHVAQVATGLKESGARLNGCYVFILK
jgi:hypothetical protein